MEGKTVPPRKVQITNVTGGADVRAIAVYVAQDVSNLSGAAVRLEQGETHLFEIAEGHRLVVDDVA